jgi:hypothetical protein
MMNRIQSIGLQGGQPYIVYFHNMARFDGVLIVKHLAFMNSKYRLKPLMRNGVLYELVVYYMRNKHICTFRDSLLLLTNSLNKLGESFCPELGIKIHTPLWAPIGTKICAFASLAESTL